MSWTEVTHLAQVPVLGARVARVAGRKVALFRTSDDRVFALEDRCPHRDGPLSQGIVHGTCVTCPLHDWVIDLATGAATGADEGRTLTFPTRVVDGTIYVRVADPPPESLAESMSTDAERSVRVATGGE